MNAHAALLVIDAQNDFCANGALAVPDGDAIMPLINRLATRFSTVVLTQDWHPPGHISFAVGHPGKAPFETITLPHGEQVLWPTHCVQGTRGAALHHDIDIPQANLIIRKGCNPGIDSYSAFLEADRTTKTGLDGYFLPAASPIFICAALPPISALPGPPRMRGVLALTPPSLKMPVVPSTSTSLSASPGTGSPPPALTEHIAPHGRLDLHPASWLRLFETLESVSHAGDSFVSAPRPLGF